jgi:hypothetical protein
MHHDPETAFRMSAWHARTEQSKATRRFQAGRIVRGTDRSSIAPALRRMVWNWLVQAGHHVQCGVGGRVGASPVA